MFNKAAPFKKTKSHQDHFLPYSALTTVTLLWALAGPIIRLTLQEVPPMHFLFFRFLIICLILLPATIIQLKKNPFKSEEIPTLIALGILSQSSLALTFIGFQYAYALDASIISLITPVLAVAAGHYYYNEKINKKVKIGVLLAGLGTLIIIIEPFLINGATIEEKELRFLGNILILTANLAFLVYTLWSKYAEGARSKRMNRTFKFLHLHKLTKKRSALEITFITFYIGLGSVIPLVIMESLGYFGDVAFSLNTLSITATLGILYMALFSSVVAYTLFEWALRISSIADTAFFNYLSPVFTLPFAYILLREVPTVVSGIGAGIIAIGVIIAENQKN